MFSCTDTTPVCRGCGTELEGSPYFKGGSARHPRTRKPAKANYFGGWVCSRSCDYRASLEQEESMPGHYGQTVLRGEALRSVNANWPEAA